MLLSFFDLSCLAVFFGFVVLAFHDIDLDAGLIGTVEGTTWAEDWWFAVDFGESAGGVGAEDLAGLAAGLSCWTQEGITHTALIFTLIQPNIALRKHLTLPFNAIIIIRTLTISHTRQITALLIPNGANRYRRATLFVLPTETISTLKGEIWWTLSRERERAS